MPSYIVIEKLMVQFFLILYVLHVLSYCCIFHFHPACQMFDPNDVLYTFTGKKIHITAISAGFCVNCEKLPFAKSRSARFTINMLIAIIFGTLSPLMYLLAWVTRILQRVVGGLDSRFLGPIESIESVHK